MKAAMLVSAIGMLGIPKLSELEDKMAELANMIKNSWQGKKVQYAWAELPVQTRLKVHKSLLLWLTDILEGSPNQKAAEAEQSKEKPVKKWKSSQRMMSLAGTVARAKGEKGEKVHPGPM